MNEIDLDQLWEEKERERQQRHDLERLEKVGNAGILKIMVQVGVATFFLYAVLRLIAWPLFKRDLNYLANYYTSTGDRK